MERPHHHHHERRHHHQASSSHRNPRSYHTERRRSSADDNPFRETDLADVDQDAAEIEQMDTDTQTVLRFFACCLIRRAAGLLQLPERTCAAAQVYLHRFYTINQLQSFNIVLMAQACLYLACKAEESLRKVRDIINVVHYLLKPHDLPMLKIGKQYWELRDEVVASEQLLLRALNFDLHVEHPHKYLLNYLKSLNASQAMSQLAWSLLNDIYYSNLCLNSTVQGASTLACGVLYLAQAMAEIFQPSAGLPSSTEGIPTVTPPPAAAVPSSSPGAAAASTEPLMSPLTARGGALSWPWWHAFQVNQREAEEVAEGLLEVMATLSAVPFDAAVEEYHQYVTKYSPPSPLRIANRPSAPPPAPAPAPLYSSHHKPQQHHQHQQHQQHQQPAAHHHHHHHQHHHHHRQQLRRD